jgi:hypothetical protein
MYKIFAHLHDRTTFGACINSSLINSIRFNGTGEIVFRIASFKLAIASAVETVKSTADNALQERSANTQTALVDNQWGTSGDHQA